MTRLASLLAACVAVAACSSPSPVTTSSAIPGPAATVTSTASQKSGPGGEPVELVRVIDGDTIEVTSGTEPELVRLIGINAPESDECHGDSARVGLESFLTDARLSLEAGAADDRDGFGRLLRFVMADNADVNVQLLRDGHAFVLQSDHERLEDYVAVAGIAAESGAGLWRADRCGEPAGEPIEIAGFEANPPGADDDPATGEYVAITHAGNEPWNLTGWVLRDESSVHRYRFPDIGILPTEEYTIHTACGADADYELFWCAGGPVWSNGGDTIILLDPAGNVVDHLTYRG